eukprot:329394_1
MCILLVMIYKVKKRKNAKNLKEHNSSSQMESHVKPQSSALISAIPLVPSPAVVTVMSEDGSSTDESTSVSSSSSLTIMEQKIDPQEAPNTPQKTIESPRSLIPATNAGPRSLFLDQPNANALKSSNESTAGHTRGVRSAITIGAQKTKGQWM